MSKLMLIIVHFLSVVFSMVLAVLIQNYLDYEIEKVIIIITSVYITMYFHTKKYKRKLDEKELIYSSLIMGAVFILIFSIPLWFSESLELMDFVLLSMYLIGTYVFTRITNKAYASTYAKYSCPECSENFTYKQLKKGRCPTCNIMTNEEEY